MRTFLKVDSASKKYDSFKLDRVNIRVEPGIIMGLIGPNGSGKTTTIKMILNMIKKDSGAIEIMGKDIDCSSVEIKQQIGVVFDTSYFVDEWNMRDVEHAVGGFYASWDTAGYYKLLEGFGINKNKRVRELSKGMQMKLMLACAFSHKASLLILDEPTSGLDPVSRDELMDILKEYISDGEHSVLFSTHITTDLEKVADEITFINFGKMIYTGKMSEFLREFIIVQGESTFINEKNSKQVLGYRVKGGLTEALIKKTDKKFFEGLQFSEGTVEDIMVLTSKGGEHYE